MEAKSLHVKTNFPRSWLTLWLHSTIRDSNSVLETVQNRARIGFVWTTELVLESRHRLRCFPAPQVWRDRISCQIPGSSVSALRSEALVVNTRHPSVSLAIPVYNEEAVIPELLRRTTAVLDKVPGGPHEIVFANDGDSDRTLELLEKAAENDDRLVIVALSRNFGHRIALTAALDHVSGDVAVLMDGDLQDPPEAIPRCSMLISKAMMSFT